MSFDCCEFCKDGKSKSNHVYCLKFGISVSRTHKGERCYRPKIGTEEAYDPIERERAETTAE